MTLMTLRRKKLIEELPKNKYSIEKAGLKAGYARNYAHTKLYSDVRKSKILEKYFNPEQVKLDILEAKNKFKKDNDNTNFSRMIELQSKISIPELRRQEITHTNPDKIIISYSPTTIKEIPDDKLLSDDSKFT